MSRRMPKVINGDMEEFKIICPFCNVPYTAEMKIELSNIGSGCPSCGFGAGATMMINITCSNCKRVVYRKETIEEV